MDRVEWKIYDNQGTYICDVNDFGWSSPYADFIELGFNEYEYEMHMVRYDDYDNIVSEKVILGKRKGRTLV